MQSTISVIEGRRLWGKFTVPQKKAMLSSVPASEAKSILAMPLEKALSALVQWGLIDPSIGEKPFPRITVPAKTTG